MYKEVGRKMKGLASGLAIAGIVISIILGSIVISVQPELFVLGLLIIGAGSVGSWLACMSLYASGELVDNSEIQVGLLYQMLNSRETAVGITGEQPANGTNSRIPTWRQVQMENEARQDQ